MMIAKSEAEKKMKELGITIRSIGIGNLETGETEIYEFPHEADCQCGCSDGSEDRENYQAEIMGGLNNI